MKTTTRMLKVFAPSVLALALGLISVPIQAQMTSTATNDDIVKSIKNFEVNLMGWMQVAHDEMYGRLSSSFKLDPAAAAKPVIASDSSGLSAWVAKYTMPQIAQALTQEGAANRTQALAAITASDTYVASADQAKQKEALAAGNANFSSESLLGHAAYVDPENPSNNTRLANRAINYVVAVTDFAAAPTTIDYSALSDEQKKKLATTALGQQYTNTKRGIVAARDLMANNLFSMLAKRVPQPGLGEKAGMDKKDASLLEVEEFAATHRAKSVKWHEDMKKASPTDVQLQMLFALVRIENLLFEQQQQNERVLATLSVTGAQNLRVAKVLQAQQEQEVKQLLGLVSQGSAVPEDINRQIQQEKAQAELEAAAQAQTQAQPSTEQ